MKNESKQNFVNAFLKFIKKSLENGNLKFSTSAHSIYYPNDSRDPEFDVCDDYESIENLFNVFMENINNDNILAEGITVTILGNTNNHEITLKLSRNNGCEIQASMAEYFGIENKYSEFIKDDCTIFNCDSSIYKTEEQFYKEFLVTIQNIISNKILSINSDLVWFKTLQS